MSDFIKSQKEIFKMAAKELADYMQTYLTEEKRTYTRPNGDDSPTIRQYGRGVTGKIAGSPRDVVDSGDLVNSYDFAVTEDSPTTIEVTAKWTAPHAERVFTGTDKIPPYPWVYLALRRKSLSNIYLSKQ